MNKKFKRNFSEGIALADMCDEDLDEEQIYEASEYISHKSNNLHRKLSHRMSVSEEE